MGLEPHPLILTEVEGGGAGVEGSYQLCLCSGGAARGQRDSGPRATSVDCTTKETQRKTPVLTRDCTSISTHSGQGGVNEDE